MREVNDDEKCTYSTYTPNHKLNEISTLEMCST